MIYTTDGAIERKDFGRILVHEHISCASNDFLKAFGKEWLDKEKLAEYAAEILMLLKERHGLGLFVDGTPIDLGRDIYLLRSVSQKSGIPIVASSGFYWFPACATSNNRAEEIASWLIKEYERGIEDTGIKPGILKCATGKNGIDTENEKRLAAIGIVQRETGLPVYVHCEHKERMAFEQIDVLLREGADIEKIIIGHTALKPEADYLEGILKTGCYISVDQCHCVQFTPREIVGAIVELCEKGYTDKILLANDLCIQSDFERKVKSSLKLTTCQQADRFGHLFTDVYDAYCEAGGKKSDWERMICENPLDILDV